MHVCNGHNVGLELHGPSGDMDTLQCLCVQDIPESDERGEVVSVS